MSKSIVRISLFLLMCLWNTHASYAHDIKNDEWVIRLTEEIPCDDCSGKKLFQFNLSNTKHGKSFTWRLENDTTRVKSIHLYESKFTVIGELPYLGDIVTVYDLNQQKVVDEIYSYHFLISSNSRYAIFRKFYPRFAPKEFRSDVILLYDFSRSPKENRVPKEREHLGNENAGIPLFPKYNAQNKVVVPNYGVDNFSVFPLAWSKKGDKAAFLTRDKSENIVAVLVDISKGDEGIYICEVQIRHREFALDNGSNKKEDGTRTRPYQIDISEEDVMEIKYKRENKKGELTIDLLSRCHDEFVVKSSYRQQ